MVTTDDLRKRFELNFEVDQPNSCWPWKGKLAFNGIGKLWYESRWLLAPVVAYNLYIGGRHFAPRVDQKCSNNLCINPYHLRALK